MWCGEPSRLRGRTEAPAALYRVAFGPDRAPHTPGFVVRVLIWWGGATMCIVRRANRKCVSRVISYGAPASQKPRPRQSQSRVPSRPRPRPRAGTAHVRHVKREYTRGARRTAGAAPAATLLQSTCHTRLCVRHICPVAHAIGMSRQPATPSAPSTRPLSSSATIVTPRARRARRM